MLPSELWNACALPWKLVAIAGGLGPREHDGLGVRHSPPARRNIFRFTNYLSGKGHFGDVGDADQRHLRAIDKGQDTVAARDRRGPLEVAV